MCNNVIQVMEVATGNRNHLAFFKDRALRYDITHDEAFIVYATSRPEFQLAKRKKKKNGKIMLVFIFLAFPFTVILL